MEKIKEKIGNDNYAYMLVVISTLTATVINIFIKLYSDISYYYIV